MKKLYDKSELLFSLTWIAIYCVLQSLAFSLNDTVGIKFSFSALFAATQTIILYLFLRRHGLFQRYGIRSPQLSAKRFVWCSRRRHGGKALIAGAGAMAVW